MTDGKPPHAIPDGEHRRASDEPARARAKAESLAAYTSWLNRNQKHGGRHSAITRNLYSWSSYKTWADKVRNSWDRDK